MAKMSKKKKVLIIVLVVVAVVGGGVFYLVKNVNKAVNQFMSGQTATTALERTDLTNTVSITGNICSADVTKVYMEATGAGKVTSVPVKVGDTVAQGDVLCLYDTTDLETAMEKSKLQAEQSAENAKISLDNSKNSYQNTKLNQDQMVRNAETNLENAKSALDSAQKKYYDALADYNAGDQDTQLKVDPAYTQAYADYSDAKASSNSAYYDWQTALTNANQYADGTTERATADALAAGKEAAYRSLQTQTDKAFDAWQKIKDEAESGETYVRNSMDDYRDAVTDAEKAVSNAEKALKEAKEGRSLALDSSSSSITAAQINADQTVTQMTLDDAQKNIDKCTVTAPAAGTITAVYATEGEYNNTGALLFVIEDLSNLEIKSTVKEYDVASLEKGMTAQVKTDATDDAAYDAVVEEIGVTAVKNQTGDTVTSTNADFDITLLVKPGDGKLKVGMNARATINTSSKQGVLAVVYSAVAYDADDKPYVMVGRQGEKNMLTPEKVYVETGLETDYEVEVISDQLAEGDLIFDNPEAVTEGVAVAKLG